MQRLFQQVDRTCHDYFLVDIYFKPKIKQIFTGDNFLLILTDLGEIYLKGYFGNYNHYDLQKVKNIPIIKFITCGNYYFILIDEFGIGPFITFIVTIKNEILIGGYCDAYNCEEKCTQLFEKITTNELFNIKNIRSTHYSSFLLDILGNVYGSGSVNEQIFKNFTKLNIPFKEKLNILLLGLGSQLIGNVLNFTKIKDLIFLQGNEIKDLQTSLQHSIFSDFNGNIYGCGNSNHFQMSDQSSQQSQSDQFLHNFTKINFNTRIKKILCPECATILLDENNELFVVGANFFGRFGLVI
ncbi:hypothetical protein ABK040_009195 [Willaertia magna]